MEALGQHRGGWRSAGGPLPRIVFMLDAVRECGDARNKKRVDDREQEDRRGDDVERFEERALLNHLDQPGARERQWQRTT